MILKSFKITKLANGTSSNNGVPVYWPRWQIEGMVYDDNNTTLLQDFTGAENAKIFPDCMLQMRQADRDEIMADLSSKILEKLAV